MFYSNVNNCLLTKWQTYSNFLTKRLAEIFCHRISYPVFSFVTCEWTKWEIISSARTQQAEVASCEVHESSNIIVVDTTLVFLENIWGHQLMDSMLYNLPFTNTFVPSTGWRITPHEHYLAFNILSQRGLNLIFAEIFAIHLWVLLCCSASWDRTGHRPLL